MMLLLLCKASFCLPSLAWPRLASPGLTLLLTFCLTAMGSTPGQDRTGDLQRVRLMS